MAHPKPVPLDWPNDSKLLERFREAAIAVSSYVESRPKKRSGKPVFRGTRFTISQFFAELGDGESIDSLAAEFNLDRARMSEFLHALAFHFDQANP